MATFGIKIAARCADTEWSECYHTEKELKHLQRMIARQITPLLWQLFCGKVVFDQIIVSYDALDDLNDIEIQNFID